MIKSSIDVVCRLSTVNRLAILQHRDHSRAASTGTAIHRGIRKSRAISKRETAPNRQNGERGAHYGGALQHASGVGERTRRPNHQQMQDVEDVENNRRARQRRITPKQMKYRQGGREATEKSFSRKDPGALAQRSLMQNQEAIVPREKQFACGTLSLGRPQPPAQRSSIRYGAGSNDGIKELTRGRSPREGFEPGSYPSRTRGRRESDLRELPTQSSLVRDKLLVGLKSRTSSFKRPSKYDSLPGRLTQERHSYDKPDTSKYGISSRPSKPQPNLLTGQTTEDQLSRALSEDPLTEMVSVKKKSLSIPYTTSASEFLYGTSVVYAALKMARRKLYKLYIHDKHPGFERKEAFKIQKMARSRGVLVVSLGHDGSRLMDKLAQGRPHNGYVLEASPLPKLPVVGFDPVEGPQRPFRLMLDHQTKEDELVNGTNVNIKYNVNFGRYPFVLMLDSILDPGNLGAILRSAHFLGVDAMAIANRNCAPLSPVTLKASAGAAEAIPLISIEHPDAFVQKCKENGWKFYAAVAEFSREANSKTLYHSLSNLVSPLTNHPTVLMLGGEGEGLRKRLQQKADAEVIIQGNKVRLRQSKSIVDSLNVSVAAAILITAFLKEPPNLARIPSPMETRLVKETDPTRDDPEVDDKGEGERADEPGEGPGGEQTEAVGRTELF